MTFYSRAEGIPVVDCPYCGDEHQPEAIEVSTRAYVEFMAGRVSCPKFEADTERAMLAEEPLPLWPGERFGSGEVLR